MGKKKKNKKVIVNRKFMLDLANRIYDPKTRQFLHLCDGTLQNGPDPTDELRPMHCGLGELYFAMTGKEPKEDRVDEGDVLDLAVELSTLPVVEEEKTRLTNNTIAAIKSLDLSEDMERRLLDAVEVDESDDDICDVGDKIEAFKGALDAIPQVNDDGCGDESDECSITEFRKRSQRVAAALRAAAKLLPA